MFAIPGYLLFALAVLPPNLIYDAFPFLFYILDFFYFHGVFGLLLIQGEKGTKRNCYWMKVRNHY